MKTLTPDDLADMLKVSRRTVLDHYVKQPGFPASVTGPRKPRWMEEAVHQFMLRLSQSRLEISSGVSR